MFPDQIPLIGNDPAIGGQLQYDAPRQFIGNIGQPLLGESRGILMRSLRRVPGAIARRPVCLAQRLAQRVALGAAWQKAFGDRKGMPGLQQKAARRHHFPAVRLQVGQDPGALAGIEKSFQQESGNKGRFKRIEKLGNSAYRRRRDVQRGHDRPSLSTNIDVYKYLTAAQSYYRSYCF
nr:hypothetical protein [Burkholderia gladioli]